MMQFIVFLTEYEEERNQMDRGTNRSGGLGNGDNVDFAKNTHGNRFGSHEYGTCCGIL